MSLPIKIKALIAASTAGVASFVNWLATVPPSQQADWLGQLTQLVPESWKPNVGLFTRVAMFFLGIYAVYLASHSGPQSPPQNAPK